MTAIRKTIAIHGSNLSHLLDYGANQEKTSVSMNGLSNVLEYAANPLKTIAKLDDGDKDLLVSGVLCKPETALVEFGIVRESYLSSHGGERYASFDYTDKMTGTTRMIQKEPVTAIHLIQSFAETDLDCHTIHQTGIELCERLGNNIEELSKCIADFRQSYESLENERAQLASKYKSLLTLKQQITYAESPSFLFGSLFDKKVHQAPEVIEKDEKDAQNRSDGKGTKEPTGKDTPHEKPPAGNGWKMNIDMDVDL